jgi:glycosyltransferase involved in cell wall biosynthesis
VRILHYIPTYAPAWSFGGPVRSVSSLCEGLSRRGHTVTVFTTDAGLESDRNIVRGIPTDRNGVEVRYFRRSAGWGIKSPEMEAAVAKHANEYDIIHVTAIWQRTGPAACRSATSHGVPYVISPRGALGPYSWKKGLIKKKLYYWIFEKKNLTAASGFHYTSQQEQKECAKYQFGIPGAVISNSLDLEKWKRNPDAGSAWRSQLGCSKETLLCGYVGRLHDKKGLDLLPEVLAQTRDRKIRLIFVGNDEDGTKKRLEHEFRSRNLQEQVNYQSLMRPDDLSGIYSALDVLLLPSRHENFGNVAIEAAACGCHVIASQETGVAETLRDLNAGEMLPRNASVWAQTLSKHRPKIEQTDKIAGLVKDAFSTERVSQRMEELYLRLTR